MFSSLLRRPKRPARRVAIRHLAASSPPTGPPRQRNLTQRTHATADFADDDDEETTEEELDQSEEEAGDEPDQEDDDEEEDEDEGDDGADEDNRRQTLPVLPLFSATHLGNCLLTAGTPVYAT